VRQEGEAGGKGEGGAGSGERGGERRSPETGGARNQVEMEGDGRKGVGERTKESWGLLSSVGASFFRCLPASDVCVHTYHMCVCIRVSLSRLRCACVCLHVSLSRGWPSISLVIFILGCIKDGAERERLHLLRQSRCT